jgi:hypothetical protein
MMNRMKLITTAVLATAFLLGVVMARSTEPQGAPVDYEQMADVIVNRSWKIQRGERVVFFWDKSRDRGLAQPLRAAVERAGGKIEDIAAPVATDTVNMSAEARARRYADWQRIFQRSQAAIWLPSDLGAIADLPFERLVESSKVRSIHFHWFLPPDTDDVATIERMYAAAIDVSPAQIASRIDKLEKALRGARVRVTADNGTDFSFTLPQTAWFHRNTGEATAEKIATARSVRDREEELPAGVLRTTELTAATGTFVGYASFDTRSALLKATLKDGRVARLESVRGGDALVTRWREATGDKDLPGEFVIGLNPALDAVLPSGFMPYYGYGAGVVRLALGDNWESGGRNRSSNGQILMFLTGATLTADDEELLRRGEIVP